MQRWAIPSRGRSCLAAAVVLSLLLRAPFLGLPMISDEGGYAYVADRWLDGEGRLYHDLWVSRPQGIVVVYGLILQAPGSSVAGLRLAAWLASVLTLVLVWRYARQWAGPGAAAVAAVAFAAIASAPAIEGFTANAEVFMALPAAGAAWLLLRAGTGGWGAAGLLGAGACAGLATLLKPSGIVMIGVGVAFVWLLEDETRVALWRSALLAAGFLAALAPSLVHGWWVGWDEFLFAAVVYRLTSQNAATAGLGYQTVAIVTLIVRCAAELSLVALALAAYHGRWPGRPLRSAPPRKGLPREWARVGRLGIVAGRIAPQRADPGTLLLTLWFLGSLASLVIGGDWWPHYLIQPAAPFAIWLARLLVGAWPRLDRLRRRALVAVAVIALLGPYVAVARGDPDAVSQAIFRQPGYASQDEVAAYLREHAPVDASIFVAFDHPALYYLADRRAAYRYLYDAELLAIPGSYGALLDVISGPDRPRYVVGTKERAPYPDQGKAFWAAVARHYHLADTIHGVPIFREDDGLGRGR